MWCIFFDWMQCILHTFSLCLNSVLAFMQFKKKKKMEQTKSWGQLHGNSICCWSWCFFFLQKQTYHWNLSAVVLNNGTRSFIAAGVTQLSWRWSNVFFSFYRKCVFYCCLGWKHLKGVTNLRHNVLKLQATGASFLLQTSQMRVAFLLGAIFSRG